MAVSDTVVRLATAPRRTATLVTIAALIGVIYVLATFNLNFLAGRGPFWAYPVGPWLQDSADTQNSLDILDYLVGFTGLVNSHWTLPLFYVPKIGAPGGTSVVFLDVIPIVALIGRVVSIAAGTIVIPYGAWVGACFVLSAVFAALFLAEAGQKSLLSTVAGAVFAVSAPTLLHRFAHLPLMAHFLIIGALWLYCRDRRPGSRGTRLLRWGGWLVLALLTNPYMLAMVSAIYAASLLRGWRVDGVRSRLLEPVVIGATLVAVMFAIGFLGGGQSLSVGGFGNYSMNLLSPFIPQRSGLFPQWQAIVDATGGQYEGFTYLGFGGIALLILALALDWRGVARAIARNPELTGVLLLLTLYALSNRIFAGPFKLLDVNLGWRLGRLVGIYRSSGRMFWPVYYGLLLGSLLFVLGRLPGKWQLPVISLCCLLQLVDSEELRARLTTLTSHGGTPVLDATIWTPRIAHASFVEIYPTFFCSDDPQRTVDMELQLMAIRAGKAFNAVYNPRLTPDCKAETNAMREGPWKPDTLYVFLRGAPGMPSDWVPPGLACEAFAEGRWCFGNEAAKS